MDKDIPIIDDAHAKAVAKAFEQAFDLKKGESKETECPKCKKKLFIARNGNNGHLFIKCESDNCLFIMQ